MGRRSIEVVRLLVDQIHQGGYQHRVLEDSIYEEKQKRIAVEKDRDHWMAARKDAIAAGELMQAEIETLRQQLDAARAEIVDVRKRLNDETDRHRATNAEKVELFQQKESANQHAAELVKERDAAQATILAQQRGNQYLRVLIEKVRGIVNRDDAMSDRLEEIASAIDEFDHGTLEPATEKRWFRSQVQIDGCVGRTTDGKDHWETVTVWVSGQPADWRQTISRASGQIPEWVWESLALHTLYHAETTFNRQTNMMEFRNWELCPQSAQATEPAPATAPDEDDILDRINGDALATGITDVCREIVEGRKAKAAGNSEATLNSSVVKESLTTQPEDGQ